MNHDKNDLLSLTPAKTYTAPKYPTLTDTHSDPAPLKKLPSRWRKNAAALACIGLLGAAVFAGCVTPHNGDDPPPIGNGYNCDWDNHLHHGGSGAAPIYVVHLTEQEALGMIRTQLETAGLNFGATPPDYTVEVQDSHIGLDLYDADKGVAIALIDRRESGLDWDWWWNDNEERAELATDAFADLASDLSVGVFYCPGEDYWGWDDPSDESRAELRASLEEHLTAQVEAFLDLLRAQGTL